MKSQINTILIPTDFSESSGSALTVGISIAKRQNASVTLLNVIDSMIYFQTDGLLLPGIKLPTDIKEIMEDKIENFAEVISNKAGIKVTGKILEGQPCEQICRLAYEEKMKLIVTGMHGSSGIRNFFMGSDAYRIVKNAPCPVLTVPGKCDKKDFKKILFPIRLIPGALEKYFYSRPIIEKNNSELFLLGLTDTKNPRDLTDLVFVVDSLKIQLHNDNIKFEVIYCQDENFPLVINKTCRELEIDLLILTANLDSDWRTFFVGAYVQQVLNQAQVPVLSIKPSFRTTHQDPSYKLTEKWIRSLKYQSDKKAEKVQRFY
jgi:nucleotide-binding universal stress UspA family protein